MKIFQNLFKKFHSQKALTGADVVISIAIILITIGVMTGIYINVTNGSKENIRYSAATRIATQISENIESMSYDEVVSIGDKEIPSQKNGNETRKIFNTTVPVGYSVKVTSTKLSKDLDIVRNFDIEVSYRVSKKTNNSVTLQVTKERELLEQTNRPDLSLLPDYKNDYDYCYPIKNTSSGYVVTTESDLSWYNYDNAEYATVFLTSIEKNMGDTISTDAGLICLWIPRFGIVNSNTISLDNATFLYGTSKHRIVFKNVDLEKNFYTYTVDYSDGKYLDAYGYVEDTFFDNDGLSGRWYVTNPTSEDQNSTFATNSYNALSLVLN